MEWFMAGLRTLPSKNKKHAFSSTTQQREMVSSASGESFDDVRTVSVCSFIAADWLNLDLSLMSTDAGWIKPRLCWANTAHPAEMAWAWPD